MDEEDLQNYSKWMGTPKEVLKDLYEDFKNCELTDTQIDNIFYIIALKGYNIGGNY